MNGLFAKGAMTELRARQGVCAGSCSTYHCFKVRRVCSVCGVRVASRVRAAVIAAAACEAVGILPPTS